MFSENATNQFRYQKQSSSDKSVSDSVFEKSTDSIGNSDGNKRYNFFFKIFQVFSVWNVFSKYIGHGYFLYARNVISRTKESLGSRNFGPTRFRIHCVQHIESFRESYRFCWSVYCVGAYCT